MWRFLLQQLPKSSPDVVRHRRIWGAATCLGLLLAARTLAAPATLDEGRTPIVAGSADRVTLRACNIEGLRRPTRCGSILAAENPDETRGRRLSISIVVVSASSGHALHDPILVLMGGPGEDAISNTTLYATQFSALLSDRDLLLIDQRGTGRSAPLNCSLYSRDDLATSLRQLFPPERVRQCEERLKAQADLTQYTYAQFARDLERIRLSLGYESFNLFAGSYGTRAAQVFMRAFPRSVRTAYLGSVVPIDIAIPLTFAKTADAAVNGTFEACGADPACQATFPNLHAEFARILGDLGAAKISVSIPGVQEPIALDRGRVVEWFRSMLYRPKTAAEVPYAIHRAYEGDWQPIVDGILASARGLDTALSLGLFFSVTCSEDLASVSDEDIDRASRGTFLGDYRVRQQLSACQSWPKAPIKKGYRSAIHSSVPTMFVSGDIDGASPLWFTRHVADGFSDRVEILHPGRGHTEWSECVSRLYERFVRSGATLPLRSASCDRVPRPPFKTSP